MFLLLLAAEVKICNTIKSDIILTVSKDRPKHAIKILVLWHQTDEIDVNLLFDDL